jgi:hypothetical protein
MLKLLAVVIPSVFAGSDTGIHYGMWTKVPTTVVCERDWAAIAVAEAFVARGPKGVRAQLNGNAQCVIASDLLVGVGDLVWARQGVSVVRNLDRQIPYVIVLADYDDSEAAQPPGG